MRLVYRIYPDLGYSLVRTDNRGENPEVLDGEPSRAPKVQRLAAFIEVSCDDRQDVVVEVDKALQKLRKRLEEVID